ncbi:unnamed protein product, partial [Musa textilis]
MLGDVTEARATSPKPRATVPRLQIFLKNCFFNFSGDVASGATSPVDTSGDVVEGDVVGRKKKSIYIYIYIIFIIINIYTERYVSKRTARYPVPYRTRETSKLRYGTVLQTL